MFRQALEDVKRESGRLGISLTYEKFDQPRSRDGEVMEARLGQYQGYHVYYEVKVKMLYDEDDGWSAISISNYGRYPENKFDKLKKAVKRMHK